MLTARIVDGKSPTNPLVFTTKRESGFLSPSKSPQGFTAFSGFTLAPNFVAKVFCGELSEQAMLILAKNKLTIANTILTG